jgi:hypothetical protein
MLFHRAPAHHQIHLARDDQRLPIENQQRPEKIADNLKPGSPNPYRNDEIGTFI